MPFKRLMSIAAVLATAPFIVGTSAAAEPRPATPHIIGGAPADFAAWPNVVAIENSGLCTGMLISNQWVLTAAHCIESRAFIGGGSGNLNTVTWAIGATGYAHPAYSDADVDFDFGLYKLDSPAPASGPFTPLAELADVPAITAGLTALAFGYGAMVEGGPASDVLNMATLSVVSQADCLARAVQDFGSYNTYTQLCTDSPTMNTCQGDSGGPIVVNVPGRGWLQVGVDSYGAGCSGYNFHALVPEAVTWIRSTMAGGPSFVRTWGADRYATAARLAAAFDAGGTVYVATGDNFPDSLAAGALAARSGSPVLLVTKDSVPPATAVALAFLTPSLVVVAGGPAVVSDQTLVQLQTLSGATVQRVSGADRYETARLLNATSTVNLNGKNLWIASGRAFADPLVASAAAALYGEPFVLVEGVGVVRADVKAHIAAYAPTGISVVGDTSTVSAETLADLATIAPVTVVPGADVHERSVRVWDRYATPGFVAVATSEKFPDALAAISWASLAPPAPLLLTPANCLSGPVLDRIDSWNPANVTLLGGSAALGTAIDSKTRC